MGRINRPLKTIKHLEKITNTKKIVVSPKERFDLKKTDALTHRKRFSEFKSPKYRKNFEISQATLARICKEQNAGHPTSVSLELTSIYRNLGEKKENVKLHPIFGNKEHSDILKKISQDLIVFETKGTNVKRVLDYLKNINEEINRIK